MDFFSLVFFSSIFIAAVLVLLVAAVSGIPTCALACQAGQSDTRFFFFSILNLGNPVDAVVVVLVAAQLVIPSGLGSGAKLGL